MGSSSGLNAIKKQWTIQRLGYLYNGDAEGRSQAGFKFSLVCKQHSLSPVGGHEAASPMSF